METAAAIESLRGRGWDVRPGKAGAPYPYDVRAPHWERPLGATEYGLGWIEASLAKEDGRG